MTDVATNGHGAHVEHAPAPPPTGLRRLHRARLVARALDDAAVLVHRRRHRAAAALVRSLGSALGVERARRRRVPDDDADRLPRRPRRLRLLAPLRPRRRDAARGSLGARCEDLEGLLPHQHGPQGDRHPVPRDDVRVLRDRRPRRDGRPRRARETGDADHGQPGLQRLLHRPRDADDLPLHHPRVRGAGELRRPADARRARHGLPAAERAVVLAAADRRPDPRRLVLRARAALRLRAGRGTPRSPRTNRWGRCSSTWPCSGQARARS